jgi:hypothetical protein
MLAELTGLFPYLGAYGPSGIFIVALLTGHLITKASHEREISTLQKALELREASNQQQAAQLAKFAELTLLAFKTVPAQQNEDSNAQT